MALSSHPVVAQELEAQPVQQPRTPVSLSRGALLLAVARVPHRSTISHLEVMLNKGAYSSITIIGHADQEKELKELKMSIYALLGKLSLEVAVQLELQKGWSDMEVSDIVVKTLQREDKLNGLLCSPDFDYTRSSIAEILDLEDTAFEEPWRSTVGFLRSFAKATLPKLSPSDSPFTKSGLFVVTEPVDLSPLVSIYKAACDRMLTLLANDNPRLTIAYADTVLIPEPETTETNGKHLHPADAETYESYAHDFTPSESPTKLWNMWALQDELNVAS
jgi:hypothetical protein